MKHAIAMHRVRGVHQRVGVIAAVRLLGSWPNVSRRSMQQGPTPKERFVPFSPFYSLYDQGQLAKMIAKQQECPFRNTKQSKNILMTLPWKQANNN